MELTDLKGVGAGRLKALNDAGILSVRDLLMRLPASYKDTAHPQMIASLRAGQPACVEGFVKETPKLARFNGKTMVTAVLSDESGSIALRWFNQPWMKDLIRPDTPLLLYGRAGEFKGRKVLISPSLEKERALLAQYRPIPGIPQKTYAGFVREALQQAGSILPETLPTSLLSRHGLMGLAEAVKTAHRPENAEVLALARRRFDFEDLLLYQAAMDRVRGQKRSGFSFSFPPDGPDRFWATLPFPPTGAQKRVFSEIAEDLRKDVPMSRLVQGDVGCGKTAIAFGAMYLAHLSSFQSALMAPTEILARQHYESAKKTLEPLGLSCCLLTGHMKAAEKREALEKIREGTAGAVIGTHALVITDEQHRFGVRQRRTLALKADLEPHTLVMSATPIPRSLALVLYSDLDLSVVDEMPPGRTPVLTRVVPEEKRAGMYDFIIREAREGHQTYIVCPLVEESDALELPSAQEVYAELCQGPLSSLRLGLTWGSQPQEEKEAVISAFSEGKLDVLVSTTVIEVGVNVPSATVMVIESADRFGLSQLPQLRGRVGRGAARSWCFLMGEKNDRLDALCRTNDGFEIAREDLKQRGPGELMGTQQHGVPMLPGLKEGYDLSLIEETRNEWKLLKTPGREADREQVLSAASAVYLKTMETVAFN